MKHLPLSLAVLPFLPCAAAVSGALAQELAVATPATREDSVRALRSARSRQQAFEWTRRHNLPWAWGGGSGHCDERIGRFCLTYGDDDAEEWQPPEEPEEVVRARERLLETLDAAAAVIPGDRWVVGQRVRYLVEAHRFDEAREAATACRAGEWWCDALRGFAAHQAGDPLAADLAFSRMLERMPEENRREWTDLSEILDTRALRRYRRLRGAERSTFEERFWTLADPLVQTRGNDLRSEHFSRNLLVALQDRAESTENLPWGSDLREILIRFGAPSGWERIRRAPYQLHHSELSLVSHYPDADLDLLPPPELLADEFVPTAGIWDDENRRARASYPLPRGGERLRWFTPLDHQLAVFRNGDSALIVAAYQLPADSLPEDARVDAALAVRTSAQGDPLVAHRRAAGTKAVLVVAAPQVPVLVSLEALAVEERRAARVRRGLEVPPLVRGVLAGSDLLVLELRDNWVPESRAEALELTRGSLRVRPGERIGVYWELYGLGPYRREALEVSLRLVRDDAGWLRRLAERAGVVERAEPVRLVWGEEARTDETLRRSLTLRIPDDIGAGRYTLELTLSARGREPLITRRALQVEP